MLIRYQKDKWTAIDIDITNRRVLNKEEGIAPDSNDEVFYSYSTNRERNITIAIIFVKYVQQIHSDHSKSIINNAQIVIVQRQLLGFWLGQY